MAFFGGKTTWISTATPLLDDQHRFTLPHLSLAVHMHGSRITMMHDTGGFSRQYDETTMFSELVLLAVGSGGCG